MRRHVRYWADCRLRRRIRREPRKSDTMGIKKLYLHCVAPDLWAKIFEIGHAVANLLGFDRPNRPFCSEFRGALCPHYRRSHKQYSGKDDAGKVPAHREQCIAPLEPRPISNEFSGSSYSVECNPAGFALRWRLRLAPGGVHSACPFYPANPSVVPRVAISGV